MQSKSMKSILAPHADCRVFSTVWSKASVCVVARLLFQEQELIMNTLDFKKQQFVDYIIAYMQILGNKAILITCMKIYKVFFHLFNASNSQQTAGWYHGCLVLSAF